MLKAKHATSNLGERAGCDEPMSQTSIEVSDFGPIAEAKVDLRPLTVFVGPSNTGKSYLSVLIYALHRFFSGQFPGSFHKDYSFYIRTIARLPNRESSSIARELRHWITKSISEGEAKVGQERYPREVPKSLAVHVRPLLQQITEFDTRLGTELCRCFGISSLKKLVRHGSKTGSRIVYQSTPTNGSERMDPLVYEFLFGKSEPRLRASVPSRLPLPTDMNVQRLSWLLRHEFNEDDSLVMMALAELLQSTLPHILGPTSQHAHYLPADRAGVMHAHQVVVSSLVERASWGGSVARHQFHCSLVC